MASRTSACSLGVEAAVSRATLLDREVVQEVLGCGSLEEAPIHLVACRCLPALCNQQQNVPQMWYILKRWSQDLGSVLSHTATQWCQSVGQRSETLCVPRLKPIGAGICKCRWSSAGCLI